jgi:hypothetical protein
MMITQLWNRTEFQEYLGIGGTDSWNSGIVCEVINGIPGIRWNWFRGWNWFQNVQHRGIGCILC